MMDFFLLKKITDIKEILSQKKIKIKNKYFVFISPS